MRDRAVRLVDLRNDARRHSISIPDPGAHFAMAGHLGRVMRSPTLAGLHAVHQVPSQTECTAGVHRLRALYAYITVTSLQACPPILRLQ